MCLYFLRFVCISEMGWDLTWYFERERLLTYGRTTHSYKSPGENVNAWRLRLVAEEEVSKSSHVFDPDNSVIWPLHFLRLYSEISNFLLVHNGKFWGLK